MRGLIILGLFFAIVFFTCMTIWYFAGKASDRADEARRRNNAVNKEIDLKDRFK